MFHVKQDRLPPADPGFAAQGMSSTGEALLLEAGEELGIDLSGHLPAFSRFQALLVQAGRQTNLTSLLDEPDIVLKHFADSLSCLRSGRLDRPLQVLDLGTGAGFPGLPLAIVRPELDLWLLDATRRKVDFVRGVISELGLPNAQALVGRAEGLGHDPARRASFERVVTRAVSSLPVLVELALPLLRVGGLLIAQKGPIQEAELRAGERAAGELGGHLVEVQALRLPVLGDPRTLVLVEKTRPTPEKYPRREGVPAKHPLFSAAE